MRLLQKPACFREHPFTESKVLPCSPPPWHTLALLVNQPRPGKSLLPHSTPETPLVPPIPFRNQTHEGQIPSTFSLGHSIGSEGYGLPHITTQDSYREFSHSFRMVRGKGMVLFNYGGRTFHLCGTLLWDIRGPSPLLCPRCLDFEWPWECITLLLKCT